jgi:hypothetical protein
VREYVRREEDRLNPSRVQRCEIREFNRRVDACDERRWRAMMIIARRDERDRAFVLRLVRVRMNALVQLRRNRERIRKEERTNQSEMDRNALHRSATFSLG